MSSTSTYVYPLTPAGITIERRGYHDWDRQAAWLGEVYPPEVKWNLRSAFRG